MDGFERITGREHDGLVEKCQENGWLKVGGFDWQDDPFLEEYSYEFSRTESLDRLREALGSGNWAIRQGFCYRDLAFIQQVNGGDEWWTLKRDGDAKGTKDHGGCVKCKKSIRPYMLAVKERLSKRNPGLLRLCGRWKAKKRHLLL